MSSFESDAKSGSDSLRAREMGALNMRKSISLPLRVVFYYESDRWIAHCLEFDLIGDGETQADALSCLSEAIVLQINSTVENKNAANLFTPAQGKFFKMFAEGKHVAIGKLDIHLDGFELEDVQAREYEDGPDCAARMHEQCPTGCSNLMS